MTKIWTLSTGGTGVFRLESYRRKPGGRRPGNPVSRRATKNRFFVHIPPLRHVLHPTCSSSIFLSPRRCSSS